LSLVSESYITRALRFRLPGLFSQLVLRNFCLLAKSGRLVGLKFQGLPTSQKVELQEWLAQKLGETLPELAAALFAACLRLPHKL
jgi:hypothetical protein